MSHPFSCSSRTSETDAYGSGERVHACTAGNAQIRGRTEGMTTKKVATLLVELRATLPAFVKKN
jgi:hypothetical protein